MTRCENSLRVVAIGRNGQANQDTSCTPLRPGVLGHRLGVRKGKGLAGTVGVHACAEGKAEGPVEGKWLEQRPQLVSQGQMALSWVALPSCPHRRSRTVLYASAVTGHWTWAEPGVGLSRGDWAVFSWWPCSEWETQGELSAAARGGWAPWS